MMNEKLDWTQKLGDAFLAQQKDVMNAVQKLRAKAQAQGNLKTTKEQKVVVQEQAIVIQPANPQVIYVPAYNPTIIYGAWLYPAYPLTIITRPDTWRGRPHSPLPLAWPSVPPGAMHGEDATGTMET
jgi:hypothetical protein